MTWSVRPALSRDLIGRKIVEVDMRPFRLSAGGMSVDPHLILDNGAEISFEVEEGDEYGIRPFVATTTPKPAAKLTPVDRKRARLLEAAREVIAEATSSDGYWAEVSRDAIARLRKAAK